MNEKKIVFWDWLGTLVLNSQDPILFAKNISYYIPYAWMLVEKFHSLNFLQVIVTNALDEEVYAQQKYAPFQSFDLIITASHFKPKPDKSMFDYALNKFSLNKEKAIFIGDSQTDKEAADASSIDFYKVDSKFKSYFAIAKDYGFVN